MAVSHNIYKLRNDAKMSQEQFAALFKVSRQSVQKWESGSVVPELAKLIEMSKYFDISLDALVLDRDKRAIEIMNYNNSLRPAYSNMHDWEFYASSILDEYQQSLDEGLDIAAYEDMFTAVSRLPKNEIKKKFGNLLFELIAGAKQRPDYRYLEPSDLEGIKALRKEYRLPDSADAKEPRRKIHGAWMGRICGCMLGKTVEGIKTDELVPFLKETGNYPMHRYIRRTDLTEDIYRKYAYSFQSRCYADEIDGMPYDDDTNYTVLAQIIIDRYGKDFTPYDVSRAWLEYQGKNAYCTAERVAYCNFVKGYEPPQSALYQNPYREWIGAQIRGDYFGYINPGNPETAAEMAWRDASISHVKNGIYGEMFVAAMLAAAAVTDSIEDILLSGLAQIPHTSRLYEAVLSVLEGFRQGVTQKDAFESIHRMYNEHTAYGWTHTVPNAMIVAASLLYGDSDFSRSICMAVETGFDTDCNGATVGSVLGMVLGIDKIPECWTKPMNDTLYTTIFGIDKVKISDRAEMTMRHIQDSGEAPV